MSAVYKHHYHNNIIPPTPHHAIHFRNVPTTQCSASARPSGAQTSRPPMHWRCVWRQALSGSTSIQTWLELRLVALNGPGSGENWGGRTYRHFLKRWRCRLRSRSCSSSHFMISVVNYAGWFVCYMKSLAVLWDRWKKNIFARYWNRKPSDMLLTDMNFLKIYWVIQNIFQGDWIWYVDFHIES